MSPGMVAEKNRFCRFLGSSRTIWRIGSRKPRSSIWSASSSTRTSTALELATPLHRGGRSAGRAWPPGRRGRAASARICAPCGTPPKTTATVKPMSAPIGRGSSRRSGWRVRASGESTSTRAPRRGAGRRSAASGAGSAARRRRSCRCRSGRCRAGRGPSSAPGSPGPGWEWGARSRVWPARR